LDKEKKCTDHLGAVFKSQKEMCEHWNVGYEVYLQRVKHGWTIEDALTKGDQKKSKCKDHLGNEFNSTKEMCAYWGVNVSTFICNIQRGKSTEEALTKKSKHFDHLGNEFNTEEDMCNHWDVKPTTFAARIKDGMSKREALTKSTKCFDHLGQEFSSEKEMCNHWGVDIGTFRTRVMDLGWAKKDALTGKASEKTVSCMDHEGNQYDSIKDMCDYWDVNRDTYSDRIRKGWSVEEALTQRVFSKTDAIKQRKTIEKD